MKPVHPDPHDVQEDNVLVTEIPGMSRQILYDVFVSHASEDKADFVRPLAEKLREKHVEVWYDEFSLRIGDSLRQSIDKGLRHARFGIVVFSPNFFAKKWPEWELDGLVAREIATPGVLLPIWHNVTHTEVLQYSPSLVDKLAASSSAGVDEVVRQLCAVIRPQGSTLVIARDRVISAGYRPPVVTDDWWLDAAAVAESNAMEGGWQSAMGWGRWGFPLPPSSGNPAARGYRLACAALQMEWQKAAEDIPITQMTPPARVHSFIEDMPGLEDACHEFPLYLSVYAPQICIPGFGGQFEDLFDDLYQMSRAEDAGDSHNPYLQLRDPNIGVDSDSEVSASDFFHGYGAIFGPSARYYEDPECIAWLISEKSKFLPPPIRAGLTISMAKRASWPWSEYELNPLNKFGYEQAEFDGCLGRALISARSSRTFRVGVKALADTVHRMSFSARLLGLPESGDELAERLLAPEFLEPYFLYRRRSPRSR